MTKISTKYLLFLVVVLAFFLRIWKVVDIPPSLSWDEASIGYNAYSILKTGRDEHGRVLPYDTFTAFGDYKPPVAVYATVPFVAIFGLNELSVRLPSVIAGFLAIFLAYLVVYELLKSPPLALLTALLFAISPWHVNLSRAGFEANIALALILLGVYLVLRARDKYSLILWSWLPFVGAIYTFNSARFFGPLLGLGLVYYCWPKFKQNKKQLILGLVAAFVMLVPILSHLLSPEARLRFTEVNIFSELDPVVTANNRMALDNNAWWANILHNRRLGYAKNYLIHFLDHFQPWFLFIRGDGNPKFSIQDVGQLYLVEAPLLVLGVLALFTLHRRTAWLLLWWIIAAIAPAAVARETPHALRIENSLPVWQIFIAFGILAIYKYLHTVKKKQLFTIIVVVIYLSSFGFYTHNYFNHYAKEYSGEWQYGYREAIQYADLVKEHYRRVVIDEIIGRPYIYVLFYETYDPRTYQTSVTRFADAAGFYHVTSFDKFDFTNKALPHYEEEVLYIMRPSLVPKDAHILEIIKVLNGSPILVAFDIVPKILPL